MEINGVISAHFPFCVRWTLSDPSSSEATDLKFRSVLLILPPYLDNIEKVKQPGLSKRIIGWKGDPCEFPSVKISFMRENFLLQSWSSEIVYNCTYTNSNISTLVYICAPLCVSSTFWWEDCYGYIGLLRKWHHSLFTQLVTKGQK